jgi:LEA14-like dessication related protein
MMTDAFNSHFQRVSFRKAELPLFLLLLLALSGCATLDQMVKKPTATFSGVKLTHADLLEGTAIFNFDVYNPNPIGIPASRITYDLKLNGKHFTKGELDRGVSLPAGTTSPMAIPVTIRYLDFFDSLTQLWRTRQAAYDLRGGFTVGPFTIPFQAQGRFELPRLPKISLESIRIERLSLLGASLDCTVKMDNPNDFNLLLKRLDYGLKLDDTTFAQASALPKGPIQGNDRSLMNLALDVSFSQLGRSAYQLLMGNSAAYALDGGLVFDATGGGEHTVPFNLTGRVPFKR